MDQRYPVQGLPPVLPSKPPVPTPEEHTVIRVYLVNGESRSIRLDERVDVNVS